ncbi:MAG: N-methyl-L-tryptophan oxidase [Candidatus Eremiobacteraeota bacterium]|nr:N-methyl-L-tryptophan oxidase [Candidatus Eremiobacteraeota bacterium]
MRERYDAIVLGLGGIGSGAAYWLARRGARVLGLEQFELGHARGESHDHSRIIRLSYHTPNYVELAKRAYESWAMVELDSGERIVYKTGGLDLGPRGGAISLDGYADAMRASGVEFETLDATEIRRRFPAFAIDDDVWGLFQADSGIVAAERATASHQRMAQVHGARLLSNVRVERVELSGADITVHTQDASYRTSQLIVCAGPWTNTMLAGANLHLPLEVTKEQAMYFRPADASAFAFGEFPVWIWMDDPSFYGFPVFGEAGAVKVTQDAGGKAADPDTRGFEEDPEITARVRRFLHAHLPALDSPPQLVKTCLYTLTPDRDFVIDTVPGTKNVHVAIGAGHAFKFASVIGRILTELALDGTTQSDISDFTLARPILSMAEPPKTYMV